MAAETSRSVLRGLRADFTLGARFAVTGGREGSARTVLTAVGVRLGVALLLIGSAVPPMIGARDGRSAARAIGGYVPRKSAADTVLVGQTSTTFRGADVYGRVLHADGPRAPVPPCLTGLPAPGDMVVSPALAERLASPGGTLLRARLPYRITGTIGDAGLQGPTELAYYAGVKASSPALSDAARLDHFGDDTGSGSLPPALVLLLVVGVTVLLVPVGVVIGTAVRFGGGRRDRRLAALRLVGADIPTTRRIAVDEALTGTLLGLAAGSGLFALLRHFSRSVTVLGISAFPADLTPRPAVVALIALGVVAMAVGVTLSAMRGVSAEPLGVVRHAVTGMSSPGPRLAVLVVGGLLLVVPQPGGGLGNTKAAVGAVLLLFTLAAALPWLVRATVRRLRGGGPLPWQLAVRRLQLDSGSAARAVSGLAVTVAGVIALHMMVSGLQPAFTSDTGQAPSRAQLGVEVTVLDDAKVRTAIERIRTTPGVHGVLSSTTAYAIPEGASAAESDTPVTVADCATLREMAAIGRRRCTDGSVFLTRDPYVDTHSAVPGAVVDLNPPHGGRTSGAPRLWTIPASTRVVGERTDPGGAGAYGVFATPGALDPTRLTHARPQLFVRLDPGVPDAAERVRNTAARIDPAMRVSTIRSRITDQQFADVRHGLAAGTALTLTLVGASLLITTIEQLRERRRLLAALTAFGTKRSVLGLSVLAQTAVPVALGLASAAACGLGLGAVLLESAGRPVPVDWAEAAALAGAGGALVLLVTALSLPCCGD